MLVLADRLGQGFPIEPQTRGLAGPSHPLLHEHHR